MMHDEVMRELRDELGDDAHGKLHSWLISHGFRIVSVTDFLAFEQTLPPRTGTDWVVIQNPNRPTSGREFECAQLNARGEWCGWTSPGLVTAHQGPDANGVTTRFLSRESAMVLVRKVREVYPDAVAVEVPTAVCTCQWSDNGELDELDDECPAHGL